MALLIVLNLGGIRHPLPYFIIATLLWFALLKSGIHATLAGVITAFTIPARPKYDPVRFSAHVKELMRRFDASHRPGENIMTNDQLRSITHTLEQGVVNVETPLQRLEHALHMPVAYLVIPVFALINAGIPIDFGAIGTTLSHPVTLGVALGLVVGKFIGIAGASWLALRFGVGQLPTGTSFVQIAGVALLGGIGFTMAIFIAELAFATQPEFLLMAKTGILLASLFAGIGGVLWLYLLSKRTPEGERRRVSSGAYWRSPCFRQAVVARASSVRYTVRCRMWKEADARPIQPSRARNRKCMMNTSTQEESLVPFV